MKSVRIQSFSGPYFPTFGLNTKRYSVSLIYSECGIIYGPESLRIRTLFPQMFGLNKRLNGRSSFTVLPKATVFYSETKCKNDMKTPICKIFENNSFTEHLRTTICDTSHYIQTLRYIKQETFVFKVVLPIDLQKNNFS